MSDYIKDLIREEARRAGVPVELALAVAEQESGFNPDAVGPEIRHNGGKTRAIGTFQLLPTTGQMLGVDPNDPIDNVRGGVTYLKQLLEQNRGDAAKALKTYGGVVTNTTYVPQVLGRMRKFQQSESGQSGQAMQDPVADLLRKQSALNDEQRAVLWDTFHGTQSTDDLTKRLQGIRVGDDVKAALWDLKSQNAPAAAAATEQSATPQRPLSPSQQRVQQQQQQADRGRLGLGKDHPYEYAADLAEGFWKGAADTAVSLGRGVHRLFGSNAIPETAEKTLGLDTSNMTQAAGKGIEQALEYVLPAGRVAKTAAAVTRTAPKAVQVATQAAGQAAAGGGVAAAQESNPTTAAAISGAMPVAGATIGAPLGKFAEKMVQAAVKPTVSAMRKVAGASVEGVDAKAKALMRFILDERITSPAKARRIAQGAEAMLRTELANNNAVTDAGARANRYLQSLERSASRQGLPAQDVATIRNAAAELLEGPHGETVITMVPGKHPTLLGPNGKALDILVAEETRQLRTNVMADEALGLARGSSKWGNKKQWGEQKGAATEASKAVERADRDAAKDAVPSIRPILNRQGKAIQSAEVLDRYAQREGNADVLGFTPSVFGAAEVASGHPRGLLTLGVAVLKKLGLRGGILVDQLRTAVEAQNTQAIAAILSRMGKDAVVGTGNEQQ